MSHTCPNSIRDFTSERRYSALSDRSKDPKGRKEEIQKIHVGVETKKGGQRHLPGVPPDILAKA